MAINLGPVDDSDDAVISQINTTPLVDVMLVLLIIFMITIPVMTTSIPLTLPRERVEERQSRPDTIVISVNRAGSIFWYDAPVANVDALVGKLKNVSAMDPQPEVHVRGDMAAAYEGIGKILLACQRAGIARVAFITEPPAMGG